MKTAAAIAILATVASAVSAHARPDSRTMSCDQVRGLIRSEGAVVMSTGRHTYDRYVTDSRQCFTSADVAVRAFIAAQDTQSCPVWRCETIDPIDRRGVITN